MKKLLSNLKTQLKKAVRQHRKTLTSTFPDEEFYGYALYSSDEVANMGPVANAETAIKVEASDPMYIYYRFSADEWNCWDDFGAFKEVNRVIELIHNHSEFEFEESTEAILRQSLKALQELEAEGLFGTRSPGRFVVVWLSDSEHPIRNESAELLNSGEVYSDYASEFETPPEPRSEIGPGPVHCAAQQADITELRALIASGADVNGCDSEGWVPLHSAAVVKNAEALKLLIASGAVVNISARNGITPLHQSNGIITAILLENGADVGAVNAKGWTPLHSAACFGRTESVMSLLGHGADPNAKTSDGKTPLDLAIEGGHSAAAERLRSAKRIVGDSR